VSRELKSLRFRYADAVPDLAATVLGGPLPRLVGPGRLLEAAAYHRLGGILLEAEREGRVALPPQLREELEGHEWALTRRGAVQLAELPAIATAVRKACGSDPIVLKGPDAASLYPSRSQRTFSDLDLLLPRDALPLGSAALRELGYEHVVELNEEFGQRHGHDVHLLRRAPGGEIHVELHWRVGDDPAASALDHTSLRASAVPLDGGSGALRPGPADRMLVFAVHFLSDRKRRLVWANDLRLATLDVPDEAWEPVFDRPDALPWILDRALAHAESAFGAIRARPARPPAPPHFGPIRAIEASSAPIALHVGRLAQLSWRARLGYLREISIPTRTGLEGTVGGDEAPPWRLALRHARKAAVSTLPRR
jgi:hypothetical protein